MVRQSCERCGRCSAGCVAVPEDVAGFRVRDRGTVDYRDPILCQKCARSAGFRMRVGLTRLRAAASSRRRLSPAQAELVKASVAQIDFLAREP